MLLLLYRRHCKDFTEKLRQVQNEYVINCNFAYDPFYVLSGI